MPYLTDELPRKLTMYNPSDIVELDGEEDPMTPRSTSAGQGTKRKMYRAGAKTSVNTTALLKGTTRATKDITAPTGTTRVVKDGNRSSKTISRSAQAGRFLSSSYQPSRPTVAQIVQSRQSTSAKSPLGGHPDPLVRARAARDLADLDYRRAVQAEPATQIETARRLGTSQANISKMRARPEGSIREGFSGATPYEVCLRHAAGHITDEQLVEELTRWDYAPGDYRTDGFNADLVHAPGSFDDVLDAMYDKLIPRPLYAAVAEALTNEDLPQREW